MRHRIRIAAIIISVVISILTVFPTIPVLAADRPIRVGWFESPFYTMDEFGRRSGYAYEYQQKIAAYTGWTYEYVEGSWPELYQMLCDGEIDLLSDVSYTEDRESLMLFPQLPMGAEEYFAYIAPNSTSGIEANNPSSFNGKRVAANKASFQLALFEEWAAEHGVEAEIIELTIDEYEAEQNLVDGEYDAFITLDIYADERKTIPITKIGSSDYYFALNKDRPELLREIDMAMSRIQDENRYYEQQLAEKYITRSGTSLFLSDKERDWLAEHGKVRVGYRDNYMSFCGTDEKTGKLTGALATFLEVASDCLANATIEFEPIAFSTTDEALEALEKGEVDCVFPLNFSVCDAEERGIAMTAPQMKTEMFGVVRKDDPKTMAGEGSIRAALTEGNTNYEMFLLDHFPEWERVYFPTSEDCFKGISKGKADCILVSNYRLNKVEPLLQKYKLTTFSTGVEMDSAFAVRRDDSALYGILNKVTNIVPEPTINSALSKFSFEDLPLSVTDFLLEYLPVVIAVLAVFVGALLVLLAKTRRSEKKALESEKAVVELNAELAENQQHLKEALEESEQANVAKTIFLSNMSHDIRTPMNAIVGYAALAEDAVDDREQVLDYITKISAASEHLLSLINDVLDMSRIESGRMTLREEEFNLGELLGQVRTIISAQCVDKGLEFDFHLNGSVPAAYLGDGLKLQQVMINILGNAVKFTPAPGKVSLTVDQTAAFEDFYTLRFVFSDTGIGMSEEFLPKIYDAFAQEDFTVQNKYGSTGLGMSITKNIITMMNGEISVESKKGEGTTFTVIVTMQDAKKGMLTEDSLNAPVKANVEKKEEASDETGLTGSRVLIVEDMMINAQMLGKILDTKGILHEWAENGKLGVDRFAATEPHYYDAVIMDIQMPVMNGLEATAAIRELDREDAKTVPIIAMSANAFSEDVQRSLQAGMNAHLSKPVEITSLFTTLGELIERKTAE